VLRVRESSNVSGVWKLGSNCMFAKGVGDSTDGHSDHWSEAVSRRILLMVPSGRLSFMSRRRRLFGGSLRAPHVDFLWHILVIAAESVDVSGSTRGRLLDRECLRHLLPSDRGGQFLHRP